MKFRFLLIGLLALILATGCDKVLYGEKTTYAKGYSASKFRKIRNGMTVDEVVSLVGEPLWTTNQVWSEVWTFSPKTADESVDVAQQNFDIFGEFTRLIFNQKGIVVSYAGDYLDGEFKGMLKSEVEQRFGRPKSRVVTEPKQLYFYSMPDRPGGDTYRRREVHFDENGKVQAVFTDLCCD